VPLRATGVPGEYVAGVRYRAWGGGQFTASDDRRCMPRSPSISTTNGTGGRWAAAPTTVAHPGGLSYDRMPVNANEAEARRRSRFSPIGHTAGQAPLPRPVDNPEHPLTLDLRRA